MNSSEGEKCLLCGGGRFKEIDELNRLPTITSDCKSWPHSTITQICLLCGHVQKRISRQWRRDSQAIYEGYTIYHLSDGAEQRVFQGGEGAMQSRSRLILERMALEAGIEERGRLLDVGCGNGGLLQSFGVMRPGWDLYAHEQNQKYRQQVLGLPGVREFFSAGLDAAGGSYNLITLLHVLEHVETPGDFLHGVAGLLAPGGKILIQLPQWRENPFDLLVADHCSHYLAQCLLALAKQAGLRALVCSGSWIAKELSVVLQAGDWQEPAVPEATPVEVLLESLQGAASWLEALAGEVRGLASKGRVGVFGTALAGTWIGGMLSGKADFFFVDEDPSRVGKIYMGARVLHPSQVGDGLPVYLALPSVVANRLATRLQEAHPGPRWLTPPHLHG